MTVALPGTSGATTVPKVVAITRVRVCKAAMTTGVSIKMPVRKAAKVPDLKTAGRIATASAPQIVIETMPAHPWTRAMTTKATLVQNRAPKVMVKHVAQTEARAISSIAVLTTTVIAKPVRGQSPATGAVGTAGMSALNPTSNARTPIADPRIAGMNPTTAVAMNGVIVSKAVFEAPRWR
jgi:hypothetical protein